MAPPIPPQASAALRHPYTRYLAVALACVLSLHLLLGLSGGSAAAFRAGGAVLLGGAGSDLHDTWYLGNRRPVGWAPNGGAGARASELDAAAAALKESAMNSTVRQNATFVSLARNSDLWELMKSIRELEDRFNHRYHYPHVFLNEEPFTEEFRRHTTALCSGKTYYGHINSPNEWPSGDNMPAGIDTERAKEAMKEMGKKPIPYGDSLQYRKMCRYQSGFFWRHPIMDQFEYYWRVEPSVKFYCDIPNDPFELMVREKKKYAFVISLYEYADTITTLWDTTKAFIKANPQYLAKDNAMKWLSNDNGETYNLCHFWSNFEIASLSLWRSEAYRAYFDALDASGGFFYERWGDAPLHSIGAALFLNRSEIHFAKEIGYFHAPFQHVPQRDVNPTCYGDPKSPDNFEFHGYSCTPRWKQINTFT